MPVNLKGKAGTPCTELALASSGIGLRTPHIDDILLSQPDVGWLEAHSENFFCAGGPTLDFLEKCRTLYPLSLHGVGLSLGSADGISDVHLSKLKILIDRFEPALVSEHLSWSRLGGVSVPDLLPLPMTTEALQVIARNIDKTQETLGRKILIENPSAYIAYIEQDMSETEFLKALVNITGCGLLLDVNNIYVSAHNLGWDAEEYLFDIPSDYVEEIHLAGYQINEVDGQEIFIDAHNNPVYDGVWDLYEKSLQHFGNKATLIEWDSDLPALDALVTEATKADSIRNRIFSKELKYAVK